MKKEILIVGAGTYGTTSARFFAEHGYKVKIVEREHFVGGSVTTKSINDIISFSYFPRIFHTSSLDIIKLAMKYVDFVPFHLQTMVNFGNELFNYPINMNSLYSLWNVKMPNEAKKIVERQQASLYDVDPSNYEEAAITTVGTELYELIYKDYAAKFYQQAPQEIPASFFQDHIKYEFDNSFYQDTFQALPSEGYSEAFHKILDHPDITVELGESFKKTKSLEQYQAIIFTGKIDQFYNYKYGKLDYRYFKFDHRVFTPESSNGTPVMRYSDRFHNYVMQVEQNAFPFKQTNNNDELLITTVYPTGYDAHRMPMVPMRTTKNLAKLKKYQKLAQADSKIYFGGRLADFVNYSVAETVELAIANCRKILQGETN